MARRPWAFGPRPAHPPSSPPSPVLRGTYVRLQMLCYARTYPAIRVNVLRSRPSGPTARALGPVPLTLPRRLPRRSCDAPIPEPLLVMLCADLSGYPGVLHVRGPMAHGALKQDTFPRRLPRRSF